MCYLKNFLLSYRNTLRPYVVLCAGSAISVTGMFREGVKVYCASFDQSGSYPALYNIPHWLYVDDVL